MPRNSQGLYTLPAGNPVVPNTLIESVWANSTMDDIAAALTGSLPRDGSAPMTGDLVLAAGGPQTSRSAVSRAYMDSFLAYATGMPVGAIVTFASLTVPPGYLLCNGQAVSRATFATLFAIIGTTYGAGDGSTTFNVPDLRDQFIRGKGDARALGSLQAGSFASHTHAVQDPGHTHAATQAAHSHTITTGSHDHAVSDPGHTHSIPAYNPGYTFDSGGSASPPLAIGSGLSTGSKTTGITIAAAGNLGGSADNQQPAVTVASSTTGETIGAMGGAETVPQNIALVYLIKAENDTSGAATVVAISSSDTNMIAIDETAPSNPELVIKSNVAFGIPKLDASGKILLSQLPTGTQQLLGYWDASGGQTPSESFPANDYVSGDTYIISVQGTLNVYNPVTLVSSPTVVAVGSLLQYIENSVTNPTGWYYVVQSATVVASQVGLTPVGSISATNVQAGFAEVDGDLAVIQQDIVDLGTDLNTLNNTTVKQTSVTGAAHIPAGTTAERDPVPQFGDQRANSDLTIQEWWNGTAWVQLGGMSQVDAEAAFLQVDGGNQMLAPLVFDSSANALVKVGPTNVAQFPTTCGIPFCKNKLFNGEVTRINQRAFDGNWAPKNTWNSGNTIEQQELCYGWDMWAKASATDMVQLIEAGNFRPSTVHTISGTGVTTRQETSPASGNWNIVVPQAARNVQVEEGAVATPFEIRPTGFELAQCQRYYEVVENVTLLRAGVFSAFNGGNVGRSYVTEKRTVPSQTKSVTDGNFDNAIVTVTASQLSAWFNATGVAGDYCTYTFRISAVI